MTYAHLHLVVVGLPVGTWASAFRAHSFACALSFRTPLPRRYIPPDRRKGKERAGWPVKALKATGVPPANCHGLPPHKASTALRSTIGDHNGRRESPHRMNEDEDLIRLRERLSDALMAQAVAVLENKLSLPR